MKVALVILSLVAGAAAHTADTPTGGVLLSYDSIQTHPASGRMECTNCSIAIPQGSSPSVTAKSFVRDVASGATQLSGDVRISFADTTLQMDSATLTPAADGTAVVRGSRIVIATSPTR